MLNLVILKWGPFEYKTKSEQKKAKLGIFDIFFKSLYEFFLKICKSAVIENFKPVPLRPIKWRPFKVLANLHKSTLLIANILKSTVLGRIRYLETESP